MSARDLDLTLREAHALLRQRMPGCDVRISCELSGDGEPCVRWSGCAFDPSASCARGEPYQAMVAHTYYARSSVEEAIAALTEQAAARQCLCVECAAARNEHAEVQP